MTLVLSGLGSGFACTATSERQQEGVFWAPKRGARGLGATLTTCLPLFLAAMAFITYVLLAGMALGIQQR